MITDLLKQKEKIMKIFKKHNTIGYKAVAIKDSIVIVKSKDSDSLENIVMKKIKRIFKGKNFQIIDNKYEQEEKK